MIVEVISMEHQLRIFMAVAEECNFTRAAEKLHISQPAISQQIQALEQQLDVRLFDRTKKSVQLNKAGEVVYHYAKEILATYRQMSRHIDDLRVNPSGQLTIGASFTFGEYILPHVIASFRAKYPKIEPHITIENTLAVVHQVARGEVDIGIIEGLSVDEKQIQVDAFAEDTMVIVASSRHPLAHRENIDIDCLEQETWMIREPGSGTREMTDHVLQVHSIHPTSVVEYASTQLIKESVEAGLGLSVLSRWAVRKELAWGTLHEIALDRSPIVRPFSIVLKQSDFRTKPTLLFEAHLHEQAAKINILTL